jgi:glycosyltransferase involved in cell wall biosynthesis
MKVGWLVDESEYVGGAELTMREFKDAAPEGTEFTNENPDVWVVGNCVTFGADWIGKLDAPVVRYIHDAYPHGDPHLRAWLLENALCVFTSPLHRKSFRWNAERWEIVPPPVDTTRFREAKADRSPEAVHVGHFYWAGKGGHLLYEWAENNQTRLNVFGTGPLMPPPSEYVIHRGGLEYEQVPEVLASYETFVHLPTGVEPFGRAVVEARAAGCKVVANRNVGALYYLQEAPAKLETAAQDFWSLVIREAS